MHQQSSSGRRFRMIVFAVVGFLILAPVVIWMWFFTRESRANAQLNSRIAQLQKAQLPFDSASLAEYYVRNTSDVDVELWLRYLELVKSKDLVESYNGLRLGDIVEARVPAADQPWPDEAKVMSILGETAALRSGVRELALRDRYVRLPIQFDSVNTKLESTQNLRELVRLIQLEAQVATRQRNSFATRNALLTMFGCARVADGQPILISQLVGTAVEAIAMDELKCALEADVLSTPDLKMLLARIEKRPRLTELWTTAINGERAMSLPIFFDLEQFSDHLNGKSFSLPWRSRDAMHFLDMIEQALAVPTEDLNAFQGGVIEVEQAAVNSIGNGGPLKKFDTVISSLVMPAFSAAAKFFVEREMKARLASVAIGLQLYEDRTAEFPERLEQLELVGLDVGKLMPLGDKPFGYRIEENRALLWGFDPRVASSTPFEPRAADDPAMSSDNSGTTNRKSKRFWVWEFVSKPSASAGND